MVAGARAAASRGDASLVAALVCGLPPCDLTRQGHSEPPPRKILGTIFRSPHGIESGFAVSNGVRVFTRHGAGPGMVRGPGTA